MTAAGEFLGHAGLVGLVVVLFGYQQRALPSAAAFILVAVAVICIAASLKLVPPPAGEGEASLSDR